MPHGARPREKKRRRSGLILLHRGRLLGGAGCRVGAAGAFSAQAPRPQHMPDTQYRYQQKHQQGNSLLSRHGCHLPSYMAALRRGRPFFQAMRPASFRAGRRAVGGEDFWLEYSNHDQSILDFRPLVNTKSKKFSKKPLRRIFFANQRLTDGGNCGNIITGLKEPVP